MATPEGNDQEVVGGFVPGFDQLVRDISKDFKREEKQSRHAVYQHAGAVIAGLLPCGQTAEALHRMPVEFALDSGDRTVFLCRDRVPAHGELVRVIINDEVREAASGSRQLHVRDFVISTLQKTLTFQQGRLQRQHADHQWPIDEDSGPVLYRRNDRLQIKSGSEYSVHIPKTRGFPHKLTGLMEQRMLLETLIEDLEPLGPSTLEPGYPSNSGIMS